MTKVAADDEHHLWRQQAGLFFQRPEDHFHPIGAPSIKPLRYPIAVVVPPLKLSPCQNLYLSKCGSGAPGYGLTQAFLWTQQNSVIGCFCVDLQV